jgi:asparagine synthetase B (glutamine-hydrolysing)
MTNAIHNHDDQFRSLLETVERLRAEHFAHLDGTLVREILRLHAEGSSDERELARAIEQAVEKRLSKET